MTLNKIIRATADDIHEELYHIYAGKLKFRTDAAKRKAIMETWNRNFEIAKTKSANIYSKMVIRAYQNMLTRSMIDSLTFEEIEKMTMWITMHMSMSITGVHNEEI